MDLKTHLDALSALITHPTQGLPEELFRFVSRLTPMINVDLLVKNAKNETLLTWREDEFYGPGWHVPGGIVRFKESVASRINAVARHELGAGVRFEQEALAMNEVMNATRDTRGHFISLLYACELSSALDPAQECKAGCERNGSWAWHARCPENLINVHGMYRKFIDRN